MYSYINFNDALCHALVNGNDNLLIIVISRIDICIDILFCICLQYVINKLILTDCSIHYNIG